LFTVFWGAKTASSLFLFFKENYIIPLGNDQVDSTEVAIVIVFRQEGALAVLAKDGGGLLISGV
jgi:hypothetical protein